MIKKLFNQRFLVASMLLTLLSFVDVKGQQFTITTPNPSNAQALQETTTRRFVDCVTFTIRNDNPCPVEFNGMKMWHAGLNPQQFGTITRNVSTNYATYVMYGSRTDLTGNPFPVTTPIWDTIAWADSVASNPLDANQFVTPFKQGFQVRIEANSEMRFLMRVVEDTMVMTFNTAPPTNSANGVTLISGDATETIFGWFDDEAWTRAIDNNPPFTSFNFSGEVSIKQLAPNPPMADVTLKPTNKCIGQDVTLKATHPKTANFGGTFTWRNSAGSIIAQNSTGTHTINNLQPSDGGKYYVTYRLCGQESQPDSIVIIMNDPPPPTVAGKFDYCLNEQFEPVTVNGTNPKWYYVPAGGSPVPVTPTINTSSPNTLIYYVSQTDIYGCESRERTLVRFRAAPQPAPPIVNTPVYYCEEDEPDQLTAIGDTLRWYYFENGGVPTQIAPTPNTSTNDAYDYFVTQTIDGCESERSKIQVFVTFRPNGLIKLDKPEVCASESITLNYYGSADTTSQYNWTLPYGGTLTNGGFDRGPLEVRLDSPGTQEIKLRVGNTGCLSELYIEEVKVKPLPYGKIIQEKDVCLGQPELIESLDYTPGLDTFQWDFAGGKTTHFTTDQGPYGVYWETAGKKPVKVTFVHDGCVDSLIDTVVVHPKPNATITAEAMKFNTDSRQFNYTTFNPGDSLCSRDSLKVSVQQVEPGASYKWTPARFFDEYSDQSATYARVSFSSNIYVEVEDVYGCQNKDSLEVLTKSCCEMFFPNAFTPNNDGRNDRFRPATIGRRQVRTFKVMNRYGQAVYETANLGGGQGWDGTFNGTKADLGTYFYMISFDCEGELVNQSGEVILLR